MKITQLPSPILRQRSAEVKLPLSPEDKQLCENMRAYIIESQKVADEDKTNPIRPGIGIAAPQVGINKRIFYVNVPANKNHEQFEELLINPVFTAKSLGMAALAGGEGCLSVPEDDADIFQEGLVKRHFKVIVTGYSFLSQSVVRITKTGYHAIVLQHEMDHINGKLFIDHINHENPWQKDDKLIIIE